MSIHRFAARADQAAPLVVPKIREEGWDCHLIRLPCDVLCWHPILDIWQPLEIATKGGKRKADANESQRKFLRWTSVPVVYTGDEALTELRKHYPDGIARAELIAWAHGLRDEFERCWKLNPTAASSARALVQLRVPESAQAQLFAGAGQKRSTNAASAAGD